MLETEVLIVGAGMTGATAGVLLARHGVRTMMISRNRWVADSPRAHIVNQRTMEVMRSIGLDDACYQQATPGEMIANLVMMTSMSGQEFGRSWSWGGDPARRGEYLTASPGLMCDLPQDRFEPILVSEANRLGVTTRFGVKFLGLTQDADGVTTTLEDLVTGQQFQVRSQYVVGADGGRSPVADAIDLPLTGTQGAAPALNVRFSADLTRHVSYRPGSLYWIMQPERQGLLGNTLLRMVRPWDEWVATSLYLNTPVEEIDHEEVLRHIKEVIQDDSVNVVINRIDPWQINHVVAQQYSQGRVLCAGDAVHRHPPSNALGSNTCVQDAFNLAWKIAAVLRWDAGPELLESYSAERQPIGKQVVDRATASWRENAEVLHAMGVDPNASPETRQGQFENFFAETEGGEERREAFEQVRELRKRAYHAHGVEMNQVYCSTAVIDNDDRPLEYKRDAEIYYQPSTHPGARLPHCWVEHQGRTCSTLDLAQPERFTLLTRPRGRGWLAAVEELASELPVELAAFRIGPGCEVADLYGDWAAIADIGETGCVLVRPDQHIAWRLPHAPADTTAELRRALRRCLSMRVYDGEHHSGHEAAALI